MHEKCLCKKGVLIWRFSCPYFPASGLNTEIYRVNFLIQSKCRKIPENIKYGQFSRSVANTVHKYGHFSRSVANTVHKYGHFSRSVSNTVHKRNPDPCIWYVQSIQNASPSIFSEISQKQSMRCDMCKPSQLSISNIRSVYNWCKSLSYLVLTFLIFDHPIRRWKGW